jgi:hypothetical protein
MDTWIHGDMETWIWRYGNMDMETRTGDMDMETMDMETMDMETMDMETMDMETMDMETWTLRHGMKILGNTYI